jgi:hypothetical protein
MMQYHLSAEKPIVVHKAAPIKLKLKDTSTISRLNSSINYGIMGNHTIIRHLSENTRSDQTYKTEITQHEYSLNRHEGPSPGTPPVGTNSVGPGTKTMAAAKSGIADISWQVEDYTSENAEGSSTTVEKPFKMNFIPIKDTSAGVWRLGVASITGGVTMKIRYGGSRNPFSNPPTSEEEAKDAINDMKGYYKRGSRGKWHFEGASHFHELFHYREWKCAANHYWSLAKPSIAAFTIPLTSTIPDAVIAMLTTFKDVMSVIDSFKKKAHNYWFSLADNAGSRPYAAGQHMLNFAILFVQALAKIKNWKVPTGIDIPNSEPPCYKPWIP